MNRIKKILVANRGEIAIRIMRTCKELGIRTVAIYSDADRPSLHVRYADEAVHIGPAPSVESYLNIEKIIGAAKNTGANAIHPGYGFLSENSQLVEACDNEKVIFIGPSSESMRIMGDKTVARKKMQDAGIPVIPGSVTGLLSVEEAEKLAQKIGCPLILKASAGGGGKGMRVVLKDKDIHSAYRAACSEAKSAFGNSSVYIEKYIENPRHIEFQIFGDKMGNYVHMFERECSIQRRHQKLIEESPSTFLTPRLRQEMGEVAIKAATESNYYNAGTVEFLVDKDKNYYFLEMNTRLQVEHPVTEFITGLDLVKLQIMIADDQPIPFSQVDLVQKGSAIEGRIYAEDPENNFLPSPGKIIHYRPPGGLWVREDSGVYQGYTVPVYYDPLLAKLITWGQNREETIIRMERCLKEYRVTGVKTTISFLQKVMQDPGFREGKFDTGYIDRKTTMETSSGASMKEEIPILAGVVHVFKQKQRMVVDNHGDGEKVNPWKMAGRIDQLRNRW